MSIKQKSLKRIEQESILTKQNKTAKFISWLREALDASHAWREEALEMYKLVEGDPATHFGNSTVYNKMVRKKLPTNVWNIMLPKLELLSGLINQSPLDIRTFARGLDDDSVNEAMNSQVKYVLDTNSIQVQVAKWVDDSAICGIGWMEVLHDMDYSEDIIFGDLAINAIFPLTMIVDPFHTRNDAQDCRYMFKALWLPFETASAIAPERNFSDKTFANIVDSERLSGKPEFLIKELYDMSRGMVRVMNVYYHKPAKVHFVFNIINGESREYTSKDEAEAVAAELARTIGSDLVKIIEINSRIMHLDTMIGNEIIEEGLAPSNHKMFPFVPLRAREFTQGNMFGLIKPIKDPQLEINKRMLQTLQAVNSSINSGWLSPKGAVDQKTKETVESGSLASVFIEYDSTKGAPQKIQPTQLSVAHVELTNMARNMIDFISGLQPELAGQVEGVAVSGVPGKAVQARQSGSIISVSRFSRNLNASKKTLGNLIVKGIQQYHPPEKILRILGLQKNMGMLPPVLDPSSQELIDKLSSLQLIPFDIVIDLTESTTTARQANLMKAFQLMQVGIPVPGEVMIELADMPMKEKFIAALEKQGMQPQNPAMANIVNQMKGSQDGGGGIKTT